MSIPVNLLRYAGIWNATTRYSEYNFVNSPIDTFAYIYVGIPDIVGGADPSVQPNPLWVLQSPAAAGLQTITTPIGSGLTSVVALPNATLSTNLVAGNGITLTPSGINTSITIAAPAVFTPAYASFSSSIIQPINPLFPAVTPLVLKYNTQDIVPQGISLVLPAFTNLAVAVSGVYKVLASVQLDRTMGGQSNIDMYPSVNGTPVPNSATNLRINQNVEDIMTVEWFLQMNAGDSVSISLFSTDAGNQALAIVAAPPVPAIPSIITTIVRIA